MAKKILGIFDRRPIIWFHYVLLTGVLFGAWFTGDFLLGANFEKIWVMAIWFYAWISIGDQLIHSKYILNVD